jgi:hypothetical protein
VDKLPISVMVVGYNEAHFLKNCLESVSFCDEIFYTDLGSSDNSKDVAAAFTKNILHRDKKSVPSCEMVQTEVVHLLKNDWVIFIDPDECVDATLATEIKENFNLISNNNTIGAVMVPWQFYFKNRKLKGTVWGGINKKYFLVNRNRFSFEAVIHYGRKILPEFNSVEISFNGKHNVLHHYWMNSYKNFISKHLRYLKNEGIDNYNLGYRVGKKKLFLIPFQSFSHSFFKSKGFKDRFLGFFLSVFWAWYKTKIAVNIFRLQNKKVREI